MAHIHHFSVSSVDIINYSTKFHFCINRWSWHGCGCGPITLAVQIPYMTKLVKLLGYSSTHVLDGCLWPVTIHGWTKRLAPNRRHRILVATPIQVGGIHSQTGWECFATRWSNLNPLNPVTLVSISLKVCFRWRPNGLHYCLMGVDGFTDFHISIIRHHLYQHMAVGHLVPWLFTSPTVGMFTYPFVG